MTTQPWKWATLDLKLSHGVNNINANWKEIKILKFPQSKPIQIKRNKFSIGRKQAKSPGQCPCKW